MRDDVRRPGSQSFAAAYGMGDMTERGYDPRGGWAGGSAAGYGRGYGPDYGRDEGRGLLERAGDRIAAWFGDDDAQDRHDRDSRGPRHRGRGPGDYTRSDDRIREDVNDRLTDDHHVDARRISVKVDQGEVTLGGTVPDRASKRRAEDVAERISGVRHVQNNLRIETEGDRQTGIGGGGRPDASASRPAGGGAARPAGPATGSGGTGSSGGTATGAATGTTGSTGPGSKPA